ncbi:MAG: carbohydrate-binding protein [Parcubacteria group bacterium]|nr:carbohydrate-binding protein [Parcubacteria group bacterium]
MRPRNIRITFLTTVFVTLLLALATIALLSSTGVISYRGLLTSVVPGDLPYPYAPQGIPIPGIVQAEDYQTGGESVAYHDTKKGNTGGQYRNDDVDIEKTTDTGGGYNVGWIETGEWLTYKVNVQETAPYSLMLRVARAPSGGSALRVEIDGQALTGTISVPSTGGWQTWTNVALTRVNLNKGLRTLKLVAETGGFNINWLRFAPLTTPTPQAPGNPNLTITKFSVPSGALGNSVIAEVTFKNTGSAVITDDFLIGVRINSNVIQCNRGASWFANVTKDLDPGKSASATLNVTLPNQAKEYGAAAMADWKCLVNESDETDNIATTSYTVTSPELPPPLVAGGATVPGIIQAEDYNPGGETVGYHDTTKGNTGGQYRADDVDIERTTDEGGGYNVGWIAEGEWLRYTVNAPTAGTYFVGLRVAMADSGPSALRLEVDGKNVTSTITVPSTGGWQKWTTLTKSGIVLTQGVHELRFFAEAAAFNLNWIKFGFQSSL